MKKLKKPAAAAKPGGEKWNKGSLEGLLKESKSRFYALAVRYGLKVKSETGRWRKTNAVVQEILDAQKASSYKPAPREGLPDDYADTDTAPEEGNGEESGEETPPEEEAPATSGKSAPATGTKPTKIGPFCGVAAMLSVVQKSMKDNIDGVFDDARKKIANMSGIDAKAIEKLMGECMDETSDCAKQAALVGLTNADYLLTGLCDVAAALTTK